MAAYRRVYDSRHLQADCQVSGSSPEPYAGQSSMHGLPLPFIGLRRCESSPHPSLIVISCVLKADSGR